MKLEKIVPFLLADTVEEKGAKHHPAANWQARVVVSERLVIGQNPASAGGVRKVVEAFGKEMRLSGESMGSGWRWPKLLEDELGECFWWLFRLSGRLGIDASEAFGAKLEERESGLRKSVVDE